MWKFIVVTLILSFFIPALSKSSTPHIRTTRLLSKIRGGVTHSNNNSISVLVSSYFGSTILSKRKKLMISHNETVYSLKENIEKKFPGV
jgi:hypothetical protein